MLGISFSLLSPFLVPLLFSQLEKPLQSKPAVRDFFLFGFAFVLGGSLGVLLFFPHVNPSEPSLAVPSLTISADGCPGDAGRGRDVVGGGLLGHQSHHGAV